jgi:hypothetical protein
VDLIYIVIVDIRWLYFYHRPTNRGCCADPPPLENFQKKENMFKSGFNGPVLLIGAITSFENAVTTVRITKTFCNFETF